MENDIRVMPQIRPKRDLRDANAISELCHATSGSVYCQNMFRSIICELGTQKAAEERIPEVKTPIAVSVKRSAIGNLPVIAIAKMTGNQIAQKVGSVV